MTCYFLSSKKPYFKHDFVELGEYEAIGPETPAERLGVTQIVGLVKVQSHLAENLGINPTSFGIFTTVWVIVPLVTPLGCPKRAKDQVMAI